MTNLELTQRCESDYGGVGILFAACGDIAVYTCWPFNRARAMHDRKQKEIDVVMLEDWERLLAGDVLTRAEVMHFVGSAEYNTEYERKGRQMATPSKSRRGRQAELNTSKD